MTTGFDSAQAAFDNDSGLDGGGGRCVCGHDWEDHEDCPCTHGCSETVCDVTKCDCEGFEEYTAEQAREDDELASHGM